MLLSEPAAPSTGTISVVRTAPIRGVAASELPSHLAQQLRQASAQLDGTPAAGRLAGTVAVTYDFAFQASGRLVHGRQVIVDHGDSRYYLTLEAGGARFAADAKAFAALLRSWQWLR